MYWNLLTFGICFVTIVFFRRIDRANLRIMKLKRFADKSFGDFKKLTALENRKYNDSTIEMDLMLKKAHSLTNKINDSIIDIESKLKGLDLEKDNLAKVDKDLQIVSNAARDVNKQIQYIDDAKKNFSLLGGKISQLSESLLKIENKNNNLLSTFNDKIRERSRELSEEIADQINKLQDKISDDEENILNANRENIEKLTNDFNDSLSKMEINITNTGNAILDNVKTKINSLGNTVDSFEARVISSEKTVFTELNHKIEKLESAIDHFEMDLQDKKDKSILEFDLEINSLKEQITDLRGNFKELESGVFSDIKKQTDLLKKNIGDAIEEYGKLSNSMLEKFRNVEKNIENSRKNLILSFEEEAGKIRESMDELSIHSISKKDEIIKAVRQQAEDMHINIESFNENYKKSETNFLSMVEEKRNSFNDEFNNLNEHIVAMKNELLDYEESSKIFSRTEKMMSDVESSIKHFSNILEESKSEAQSLEQLMYEIGDFSEIKRDLEKELKIFAGKKEKFISIENEIHTLMDITNDVKNRTENLENNTSKIDNIENKINVLTDSYESLNQRIAELQEYESTISNNLEKITYIDKVINSVDQRVIAFQKNVDNSEKKINKLKDSLASIEENTLILKSKEREIRDVKDKFSELDGLSAHLEKRIEQINAMISKIENVHTDIEKADDRLQSIFNETDKKMQQFSDFIKAAGSENFITKEFTTSNPLAKNINDSVIKTVRELSSKGWPTREIAQKLMIEENSVRFIINSASI